MSKLDINPKAMILLGVLAVVVIGGLGALFFLNTSAGVEVDTATKADIYRSVEDVGKVRSERMIDLNAAGTGKILAIRVEVGDEVKAGDLLATIDDKALNYQVQSLEYQIKSLESNISYLADPLSDLSLANFRSSVKIAKENSDKAKSDYQNAKALFELGAISRSELDSLELLSTVSEMNYIMALNESSVASKGGDDDVIQQYNFQLKSLIPQLEALEDQISEFQIRAPFDGTVGDIYVEEGESVMPMSPVVQVYENRYYIESSLLEESLVLMEMDAPVEIFFDTTVVEGIVRKIHPTIKTVYSDLGVAQQKGIVEISVDHDFSLMGREVELTYMLGRRKDVLTVDKDAVVRKDREDYVYVVKDDIAKLVKVSVGSKGNNRCEILEGLQENDLVIVNPASDLEDGDKVSY